MSNKTDIRHSGGTNHMVPFSLRSKMFIYFGVLFTIILVMLKWVEIYGIPFTPFRGYHQHERSEVFKGLNLVVDLKQERLLRWIEERKGDAKVFSECNVIKSHLKGLRTVIQENINRGMKAGDLWDRVQKENVYRDLVRHLNLVKTAYGIYESIEVIDVLTGTIVASTGKTDLGVDISQRSSFASVVNSGEIHIAIEEDSHDGREFGLHICYPIRNPNTLNDNEERVTEILTMHINPDDIIKPMLHTGKGLGQSGEVLLVTEDVKILTSLKHPLADGTVARPLKYQIKAKPAMRAAQGEEGIIATEDYRGIPVLAAYRYIPITSRLGWGMVVKRDQAEIFAPLRESMVYSVISGAIGLLMILGLVNIIANKLSRPINVLSRTAKQVEAGDLSVRAQISTSDEVGSLVKTFNSMIQRIQRWHEELEEQVQVRTSDLNKANKKLKKEISERKWAEKELGKAKTLLEKTFTSLDEAVYVADTTTRTIITCNPAVERIFGYSEKEVAGRNSEFLHVDRAMHERFGQELFSALDANGVFHTEFQMRRKNGTVFSTEHTVTEIIDDSGNRTGFVSVVRDITERKRAEEELRQSEEKYRTLVEHSLQGITIIQGIPPRPVFANSTMVEILGYTAEEVLSLSAEETRALVHPEDQEFVWERYQDRLSGKTVPSRYEYRGVRKDGTVCWLEASASRIEYREGPAVLAALVDITERKRAEEELKRKNEELESFIYIVSHDLKTPLITVQGFVSALEEDCGERLGKEARRQLGFIRNASKKMEALIKDLLELSRIGRVVHAKEEVDFSQVVEESLRGFKKRIEERGIELVVADQFPVVRCERQRMTQAMENLVSNAVKFLGDNPSPRIEVGYREEDGFHRFWVKDNGIGIDPQYHGKVFELFRCFGEVEGEEGTGVGLTIVRKIVEQHGGRIWVESIMGKGSTFYFTLPRK